MSLRALAQAGSEQAPGERCVQIGMANELTLEAGGPMADQRWRGRRRYRSLQPCAMAQVLAPVDPYAGLG